MGKMGKFGTNATDYSYLNDPIDQHNPCEIVIRANNATYIDVTISFVASAYVDIYTKHGALIETITGVGFNSVPDQTIGIAGDEIRLVYRPLVTHQYESTGFLGSYESNGTDADEEILTCNGSAKLVQSAGMFHTDGSKIVKIGEGMTTPCEWIIEPPEATEITISFDEIHKSGVDIYDENGVKVWSRNTWGTVLNLDPIVVPGGKVIIKQYRINSTTAFWSGMYTSNGNEEQCVYEEDLFHTPPHDNWNTWTTQGDARLRTVSGQTFFQITAASMQESSAYSPEYQLTDAKMVDIQFESAPSFSFHGGFALEVSIDGGAIFQNLDSYNANSDFAASHLGGVSFNHTEVYEGPFTDNTVFRFRTLSSSGNVKFHAVKITAHINVDDSTIKGDLDLPTRLDVSDPPYNLASSYPNLSLTINGQSVTDIDPSSLGVGLHNIEAVWQTTQFCRLNFEDEILIIDENDICDDNTTIEFPTTLYTHQLPYSWTPPTTTGVLKGDLVTFIGNNTYTVGTAAPNDYSLEYIEVDDQGCTTIVPIVLTIEGSTITITNDGCPADCSSGAIIHEQGFEGDYLSEGWFIGSSEVALSSIHAASGNYSMRLRDNSGYNSSLFSPIFNGTDKYGMTVEFSLYASSFESGEDFFVEISTDGGGSYVEMGRYIVNQDFNNDVRTSISASYTGALGQYTRIRIRCDASNNNDLMYIDDVVIKTCNEGSPPPIDFIIPTSVSITDGIVNITTSPMGGVLSGVGITGNSFDPTAAAGIGIHEITYSYEESDGCGAVLIKEIEVVADGFSIDCLESRNDDGTNSGAVEITVQGGNEPFQILVDGIARDDVEVDNQFVLISGLNCGEHILTVIEGNGETVSCDIEIDFSFASSYNYVANSGGLEIDLSCLDLPDSECSGLSLTSNAGSDIGNVEFIENKIIITGLTEDALLEFNLIDGNGDLIESLSSTILVTNTSACANQALIDAGYVRIPIMSISELSKPPGFKGDVTKNDDYNPIQLNYTLEDGSSDEISFGQFRDRLLVSLSDSVNTPFSTVFHEFVCGDVLDLEQYQVTTGSGASFYLDFNSREVYVKLWYCGFPTNPLWNPVVRGFIWESLSEELSDLFESAFANLLETCEIIRQVGLFGKDDFHLMIGDMIDLNFHPNITGSTNKEAAEGGIAQAIAAVKLVIQLAGCRNSPPDDIEAVLVPKCLWFRADLPGENCTPGLQDLGEPSVEYIEPSFAGVIDGLGESVIGAVQLVRLMDAWDPTKPLFYQDDGRQLRIQTGEFFEWLHSIYEDDEFREMVQGQIAESLSAYLNDLTHLDCKGEYLQGKALVGIADLLLGLKVARVKKFAAILKKGALGVKELVEVVVSSLLRADKLAFELIENTADGRFIYRLTSGGNPALELTYKKGEKTIFKIFNTEAFEVIDWFEGVDNFALEIAVQKKAVRLNLSQSGDQDLIDDIARVANGEDADNQGRITESIMRRVFDNSDVEHVPENILKIGSNNGFDHLLLKRDANGKIIDAVIFDSKQKSPSVKMNEIKNGTIVQMTDPWVDDVLNRMQSPSNSQETIKLGKDLEEFKLDNKIKLKVAAVERTSNEVWVMNIGTTK